MLGFLGISVFGYDCHIDDVQMTHTAASTCTMHTCAAAASADLAATMSGPASAATNANASFALGVTNNGPQAASSVQLATATPVKTTFVSIAAPAGWSCINPAPGATGSVTCTAASLAASANASFTMVVKVDACAGNGSSIAGSATVSSSTTDPSPANNAPSANTTVVDDDACDDGNACTQSDGCQAGACVGANPVVCTASDPCHIAGSCNQATGVCSNPAAPDGTVCSDGNACTVGDTCGGGSCQAGPGSPNCSDVNPCTDDFCVPASGCGHVDNTVPCDDGNACTVGDTCGGGVCNGGAAITTPPETQDVAAAADKATYDWSAASFATRYDVVRGTLGKLPVGSTADEVCFDDLAGTSLVDPAVPDPDTGFWYLSRGENACGIGTFGNRSDGSPRTTTACP